nr:hypothetical protein [uncultured Helicobacter sp.]
MTDCRIKIENIIGILQDNDFQIFGVCFGECLISEYQKKYAKIINY